MARGLAALVLLTATAPAQEDAGAQLPGARMVRLDGPLEVGMLSHLRRAFAVAQETGEPLVVAIDSPGGEVELMWQLANAVADASDEGVTTVGWVDDRALSAGALVALACERLYMRSHATIGAALPVTVGVGGLQPSAGDEDVREKLSSALRSEFRGLAERMGRPGVLAEAMVDPELTVRELDVDGVRRIVSDKEYDDLRQRGELFEYRRTIVASGELFAATGTEAVDLGLADGIAESLEELTEKAVGRPVVPRELPRTASEDLASLLYTLTPLFFLLGILFAFVEFKVPGFGVPGILSIACFAVLLFGRYLVGLADVPHVVLLVVGTVLLAVELFVVPGTLWVGLLGGVAVLAGLAWSLAGSGSDLDYELGRQIVVDEAFRLVLAALAALVGVWLLSRWLPNTPVLGRLVLAPDPGDTAFAASKPDTRDGHAAAARPGAPGVAITALRPVGKVALDGDPGLEYEARSEGPEIRAGARVRVVEARSTGRLVVAPETEEPAA